jgi:hypothetical protein
VTTNPAEVADLSKSLRVVFIASPCKKFTRHVEDNLETAPVSFIADALHQTSIYANERLV